MTGDHVVARSFFPERLRADLPQVPACETCNNYKSGLEHYLATVLPLAGRDRASFEVNEKTLERKLANNAALHDELNRGFELHAASDLYGQHGTVLRPDVLSEYSKLLALGLLRHHFDYRMEGLQEVRGAALAHSRSSAIDSLHLKVRTQVSTVAAQFAEGALTYRGFAATANPGSSFWQIRLYGGLHLGADLLDGSGRILDRFDLMAVTFAHMASG